MTHSLLALLAGLASVQSGPVAVQGQLRGDGGEPVDGQYAMTFTLYDQAVVEGQTVLYEKTLNNPGVTVADGVFQVALEAVPAAILVDQPQVWIGVQVGSEPELARQPLRSTPLALAALRAISADSATSLACTGCVGFTHLAGPGCADGDVLKRVDGAWTCAPGGVLVTSQAPVCNAESAGAVHFDPVEKRLYVCDGKDLQGLVVCSGTCPDPSSVPCGNNTADACGKSCPATGTGPNPAQCADPSATACGAPATDACGNGCGTTGTQCEKGVCVDGDCKTAGQSSDDPGLSCLALLTGGGSVGDGKYWLDPDGAGPAAPFQAYCDMTTDLGGWTLVMKQAKNSGFGSPLSVSNWSGWSQANVLMNETDATTNDGHMVNLGYSTLIGSELRMTASQTWTDVTKGAFKRTINSTAYTALSNAQGNKTGNEGGNQTVPWTAAPFTDHTITQTTNGNGLCWRSGPYFNQTSFDNTNGGIKWGYLFNNECGQGSTDTAEGLGCCGNSGWYRESAWTLYLWVR